jgi:L-rhamnose isomerase
MRSFSAEVDRAVTDIPDTIRDQIHAIYAEHDNEAVRDLLTDWAFFERWRWGDGWMTDERGGARLGIFHDQLAQRVRAAAMTRVMEA